MELLDIVNENNELTGKTVDREIVHQEGLWHREISVIIVNQSKELLIQRRSPNKKLGANMWSVTAGHIDAGEEPIIAALRETEEELGLNNLKTDDFHLLMIQKTEKNVGNIKNNHFKYIYLLKTDKEISKLTLQETEVSEAKYISISDLQNIIKDTNNCEKEYTKIFFREYFQNILEKIKSE